MKAAEEIEKVGFQADLFDWHMTFSTKSRQRVPLPGTRKDPCHFSVEELRWLRQEGILHLDQIDDFERQLIV